MNDPYFIWDGSFEYFNCKCLTKKKFNGNWNINKEEIIKYFNESPITINNIQIYKVTDEPVKIGFAATKNKNDSIRWKYKYNNDQTFREFVDNHNNNVFEYFRRMGFSDIESIYNESITNYSSDNNCGKIKETIKINEDENNCMKKFPEKNGYIRHVINTNPCTVRYINVNNPNDFYIEEENLKNIINKQKEIYNDNKNKLRDLVYRTIPETPDINSEDEYDEESEESYQELDTIQNMIKENSENSINEDREDDEGSEDSEDSEYSEEESDFNEEMESIIPPPPQDIDMNKEINLENQPINLIRKSKFTPTPEKKIEETSAKKSKFTPIPEEKVEEVSVKKSKFIPIPEKKVEEISANKSKFTPIHEKKVEEISANKSKFTPISDKKVEEVSVKKSKFTPTPEKKEVSARKSKSIVNSKSVKLDINNFSNDDKIIYNMEEYPELSRSYRKPKFDPMNVVPIRNVAKKYKTINRDGTVGNILREDQECMDKYEIIRQFLIDTDTHLVKNRKTK